MPRGFSMTVDIHEAMEAWKRMSFTFSRDTMNRVLHDTIVDTGKRSKTILKKAAAEDFAITQEWAAKQVRNLRMTGPASGEIPLDGHRGVIGKTFKMDTVLISRKKGHNMRRRVKAAHILRSGRSMLPEVTPHQGGNNIFPVGEIAATRSAKKRLVRVVGKSLPQMLVNSPTSETVDERLGQYMLKRMEHHIERATKNWA